MRNSNDGLCPTCGEDFVEKKKLDLDDRLLSESIETVAELEQRIKEEYGVLKPKDNAPRFLPQKQPRADGEGITLYTHWESPYFIAWNQIKTSDDILMFVLHLTEKVWVNRKNIQFLIEQACLKHGIGWFKHEK